jgi:hypothetical protein
METKTREIMITEIVWESEQEHDDVENILMLLVDENIHFYDLSIQERDLLAEFYRKF